MFYVYCHTNKTNGKKYIGITSMIPSRRWNNGKGYSNNKRFYEDIKRFGWDGFDHDILYEGLSEEEAVKKEASLIEKYNTISDGYNNHPGNHYGKAGSLSPLCNRAKDSIKYFCNKRPDLENLFYWYKLFEEADKNDDNESDLAYRIDCYTNIILHRFDFFGMDDAECVFPCYDMLILAKYLHELNYIFRIEQYVENGGDFPKYISPEDVLGAITRGK